MNRKNILPLVVAGTIMFSGSFEARAQSSTYTTSVQDQMNIKDMEKKVDATIRVLSIIKEELEEERSLRQQPVDRSEDAWADNIRKNIKRIKRLWAELKKMQEEDQKQSAAEPVSKEEAEKWASDMQDKLDKSIEAMQILKEELDTMDK